MTRDRQAANIISWRDGRVCKNVYKLSSLLYIVDVRQTIDLDPMVYNWWIANKSGQKTKTHEGNLTAAAKMGRQHRPAAADPVHFIVNAKSKEQETKQTIFSS